MAGRVFALLGANGAGKTTTMARITVRPITIASLAVGDMTVLSLLTPR
jgi:ABC-type multidrug transport system ATPase subunit